MPQKKIGKSKNNLKMEVVPAYEHGTKRVTPIGWDLFINGIWFIRRPSRRQTLMRYYTIKAYPQARLPNYLKKYLKGA